MSEYLESQKYNECMLVSVINAAVHLGEPVVNPDSEEYERLVDMTRGRYGSCICIDKAVEYFRLEIGRRSFSFPNTEKLLRRGLPVELAVTHQEHGIHSVLVVDVRSGDLARRRRIGAEARVLNFRGTDERGWIPWKELAKCVLPTHGFGSVGGSAKKKWAYYFQIQDQYLASRWWMR